MKVKADFGRTHPQIHNLGLKGVGLQISGVCGLHVHSDLPLDLAGSRRAGQAEVEGYLLGLNDLTRPRVSSKTIQPSSFSLIRRTAIGITISWMEIPP